MKHIVLKGILIASFSMHFGCSLSESDTLYANCVSIGMEEQMVGWEESDRPSVKAGVEQGCDMLIKECEGSPDGELCDALNQKFK